MPTIKDELQWLEAARTGDREGFERLARVYEERIFNFALKMCGHAEDARDIVQDTLLAAFKSIRGFRGDAKLSTWFFKVAMSACHRMRRKSKFQTAHVRLDEVLPQLEAASARAQSAQRQEDFLNQRERELLLDAAIRTVPLGYRLVLVLRDVQGFSTGEVADILGLTATVVKVRLHRARLFLKEKLQPSEKQRVPQTAKTFLFASDCKELLRVSSRYLDGDLERTLCVKIRRHLGRCKACDSLCRSLKENLAECKRARRHRMPASLRRQLHASLDEILP